VFPRCRGETRFGEWWSEEVGEVDKAGDIGRMGEIGDRFLIALASIISIMSEARVQARAKPATKRAGRAIARVGLTISWITSVWMEMILMNRS
jgi:hypothetical protein